MLEDLDFCFLTVTWVKDEDCDSMNRLTKARYCFRNISREDKNGGGSGIIYRDGYNSSLVSKGRHVIFKFSQWQIKIGKSSEYSHSIKATIIKRQSILRFQVYGGIWRLPEG